MPLLYACLSIFFFFFAPFAWESHYLPWSFFMTPTSLEKLYTTATSTSMLYYFYFFFYSFIASAPILLPALPLTSQGWNEIWHIRKTENDDDERKWTFFFFNEKCSGLKGGFFLPFFFSSSLPLHHLHAHIFSFAVSPFFFSVSLYFSFFWL